MTVRAFDTETGLIIPGLACPPLTCISSKARGEPAELRDHVEGIRALRSWLAAGDVLVTANGVYDFGVCVAEDPSLLPLVFDHYERGLVRCVQNRQKLLDIATGDFKFSEDEDTGEVIKTDYSLKALAARHLGKRREKGKKWELDYSDLAHLPPSQWYEEAVRLAEAQGLHTRFRYARLRGVPLAQWEPEAVDYALEDASDTLAIHDTQGDNVEGEAERNRTHWALFLMRAWGVRTDGAAVAELRQRLEHEVAELRERLKGTGFFREPGEINPKTKKPWPKGQIGTKNTKVVMARVEAAYATRRLPITETGQTSTSKDTLLLSGDPDLETLQEYEGVRKLLSSFVPMLELGTLAPICAQWNPIVATLRTSCAKPALQTPPRKGGVRECFAARKGVIPSVLGLEGTERVDMVIVSSDYDTAELRSLAQKLLELFGRSALAQAFVDDLDPHLMFAARMLGLSYEETLRRFEDDDEAVTNARQLAKIPNFGYPGGMSARSLVPYARGMGVKLCEARGVRAHCKGQDCDACEHVAEELRGIWLGLWPEMLLYFDWIRRQLPPRQAPKEKPQAQFDDPVTKHRRMCGYTDAANGYFQTRTAVGATRALWRVTRECYLDRSSPLYGSRPWLFFHDQIMLETPAPRVSGAARRLADLMIDSMQTVTPNVRTKTTPVAMARWYKKAKPVYDAAGELVPWVPKAA